MLPTGPSYRDDDLTFRAPRSLVFECFDCTRQWDLAVHEDFQRPLIDPFDNLGEAARIVGV